MNFTQNNAFFWSQYVDRYQGNKGVRTFTCLDQFICMAFAQLTYRESLRDIECCLLAMREKLYIIGIKGKISHSTLADANEKRDWRIYNDFAQILIDGARQLYADDEFVLDLRDTVYVLVAIIKKRLKVDLSLYTILQILSITLFESDFRKTLNQAGFLPIN